MPYYRQIGEIPPKRHTQFRAPSGALYAEELVGQEGFSSDSSLLYHRHLPTAIVAAEEYEPPAWSRMANRPLKPRHFQTHKLSAPGLDAVLGRQHLLANDDVRISYAVADRPSPLYRNAIGDECLYVEAGSVVLESTFRGTKLQMTKFCPSKTWCTGGGWCTRPVIGWKSATLNA